EGSTVGDTDNRCVPSFYIGHADDRPQGKRAVSGGHGVHVIDLAIRTAPVVIGRAVPAGQAGFNQYGFSLGRKRRRVVFFSLAPLAGIFFVSRLGSFGLRFSCPRSAVHLVADNFGGSFSRLRWLNG